MNKIRHRNSRRNRKGKPRERQEQEEGHVQAQIRVERRRHIQKKKLNSKALQKRSWRGKMKAGQNKPFKEFDCDGVGPVRGSS